MKECPECGGEIGESTDYNGAVDSQCMKCDLVVETKWPLQCFKCGDHHEAVSIEEGESLEWALEVVELFVYVEPTPHWLCPICKEKE